MQANDYDQSYTKNRTGKRELKVQVCERWYAGKGNAGTISNRQLQDCRDAETELAEKEIEGTTARKYGLCRGDCACYEDGSKT